MFHLFSLKNVLRNFAVHSCPPVECYYLKKIMGRKEEGNAPPCTKIILRQRHNGMSSRLLTWLSIVVKVIKKKKSRSRSLDTYYCSVFVIFLILWTIFWAHMMIFAELYIILHGHAVSNNRLADFCRPLFPINLSRTGFQLYEIDDLSKNAAWFHLAKKFFD